MYEKFKERKPYALLDTSKYPPEVAGRFNSFITTQFDDSLSVEMQMRSIVKWAIDNFKDMDQTYNDFTEYILNGNINPFIEMLNDLIEYMNYFISEIDNRLTENIGDILNVWLNDGTLAEIINNDVFDMKTDKTYVDSEIERLDLKDEVLTTQLSQIRTNVKSFGAIGDGVTDDTTAIKNAIEYANDNETVLFVPKGEYLINDELNIQTDVKMTGTFITTLESEHAIKVTRKEEPITINPLLLGELSKGSNFIQNLSGYKNATFVIESDEIAIDRLNHSDPYRKIEASKIISNQGAITPSLQFDYDKTYSSLKLTVYPYERPLTLDINIRKIGENISDSRFVSLERSDVFINLNTSKIDTSDGVNSGLSITRAVNVTVGNQTHITGLASNRPDFLGYGVTAYASSIITLDDPVIFDCRHSVSGRMVKNMTINKGVFNENIDCHYGYDFKINGSIITTTRINPFTFSGEHISIKNVTVYGDSNLVGLLLIRSDTPEFGGNITLDNIRVIAPSSSSDLFRLVGHSNSTISHNFNRELKTPDAITASNVLLDLNPNQVVTLFWNGNSKNFNQEEFGTFIFKDIVCKNDNVIQALYYNKNSSFTTSSGHFKVFIENINFNNQKSTDPTESGFRLGLVNDNNEGVNGAVELIVNNCENIKFWGNRDSVERATFNSCSLIEVIGNEPTRDVEGFIFNQCVFHSTSFVLDKPLYFYDNIFSGDIDAGVSRMSKWVRISKNNYSKIGTTGNLEFLNDHVNEEYYNV